MKAALQTDMDARIAEVRRQYTIFDIAISAVETVMSVEMTAVSPSYYVIYSTEDTGSPFTITVSLDVTGTVGAVNIAVNSTDNTTRLASMNINENNEITETLFNVDTVANRQTILSILTEIFTAVKSLETTGGENDESSGEVEST